jgi:hypothetical protein
MPSMCHPCLHTTPRDATHWSTYTMARTQAVSMLPYSGFGVLTSYACYVAADLARKHDTRIVILHCVAPIQAEMHYKAGFRRKPRG